MFAFKCGNDSKNKLKGVLNLNQKTISSKNTKKIIWQRLSKNCDIYILPSINQDMYLQEVKNPTLFVFDDKRCYKNNIESKPWD